MEERSIVSVKNILEEKLRTKILLLASLLIVASMALSACAPAAATVPTPETIVQTVIVNGQSQEIIVTATPDPNAVPQTPAQPKVLNMNLGLGDIPTLDPALATDNASIQILEETYVGLTRLNEESIQVVPGMAENWDISEDGLTYTFHLRNNVPWVKYDATQKAVVQVNDCDGNPRMVKAQDFVYGTLRTLNPATASDYAYVLGFALKGANDYNQGVNADPNSVGIKAVDDNTLEMTFISPAAYNINIAGMWVAYAQPSWIIDGDDCTQAAGDRWPETGFNESYGPWTMKEWIHDSYLTLTKNPFWPATDEIPTPKVDEVVWNMLDAPAAFAEYEAGNMDVSQVPLADMDRAKADPVLSKELNIAPALSSYYYGFNTQADIVSDVRVRRALSLAVDRQSLIDNVTKSGQEPAQWFCRPGLVACPTVKDYPDLGVKYDPEQAKAVLQEYLDETGQTADQLKISLMFNTGEGHQRIAEALQGMWKDVLGINVSLTNQEWKVFLKTVKGADTPQIYRSGWNLDYPDANNFDREVVASGGNDNPVDANGKPIGGLFWKDANYEKLIAEAAVEQDPAKRIEMYAQAEKILVWDDAVVIPIYWYTAVSVTKPYVSRTFSNTGAQHVEKWDVVQ